MSKQRALGNVRNRRWRLFMAASLVAAGLGVGQIVYAAHDPDGPDVVGHLIEPGAVVDAVAAMSGAIGADGAFSDEPNASAVPFLGSEPGTLVGGLFGDLDGFPAVEAINVGPDDLVEALDLEVEEAFGAAVAHTRTYDCGGTPCVPSTNKVSELTEMRVHLTITGDAPTTDIPFTSIGLPSLGFVPEDAELNVDLGWTLNATLIADAEGLQLAPAASGPELDLTATIEASAISPSTSDYLVDLGALKVRATTLEQPAFTGTSSSTCPMTGASTSRSATTRDSTRSGASRPRTAR